MKKISIGYIIIIDIEENNIHWSICDIVCGFLSY